MNEQSNKSSVTFYVNKRSDPGRLILYLGYDMAWMYVHNDYIWLVYLDGFVSVFHCQDIILLFRYLYVGLFEVYLVVY